jgi:uncharacterized SAM-binding protein YcdF (DUF218 family)
MTNDASAYVFRRSLTLVAIVIALIGLLLIFVSANYAPILRIIAVTWAVSDTIKPADAVVVLGGGAKRPYAAADLFQSGLAKRILVDEDANRQLLLNLSVPSEVVTMFGSGLKNTYQEACALTDWARKSNAHQVIIPTETFPSRRVRWIFARKLETVGTGVMINLLQIPGYSSEDWWSSSAGFRQFLTEIAKYSYYRARYMFDQC